MSKVTYTKGGKTFTLDDTLYAPQQQLNTHMSTDRFRWQDTYDEQRESIIRDASNVGLDPWDENTVEVPASEGDFTVNDTYGGVFGVTMQNTDTTFTIITINGEEKYTSDGLTSGVPITKYFWLQQGDVVSATNAQKFTYTPFREATDSPYVLLVDKVDNLSKKVDSVQNQIYDIQAGIANKILDPDPSHISNVEDGTFTVSNDLGGRLNGEGYTLLGLPGVRLVSTGTVDVTQPNGTTNREYDNTSLLGVGPAELYAQDVSKGCIVVSNAMGSLTYTPYIPGSSN